VDRDDLPVPFDVAYPVASHHDVVSY